MSLSNTAALVGGSVFGAIQYHDQRMKGRNRRRSLAGAGFTGAGTYASYRLADRHAKSLGSNIAYKVAGGVASDIGGDVVAGFHAGHHGSAMTHPKSPRSKQQTRYLHAHNAHRGKVRF